MPHAAVWPAGCVPVYYVATPSISAVGMQGSNSSTAGLRIVLSDKLLKRFPNLQLGAGMSHHAAVKDQVQGAEDINHIRLAQRYA